jgi:hypothetical protein
VATEFTLSEAPRVLAQMAQDPAAVHKSLLVVET